MGPWEKERQTSTGVCHAIQRGVSKQQIFEDGDDVQYL